VMGNAPMRPVMNLRDSIKNLQDGPRFRWVPAVMGSLQQSWKRRSPVMIYVDEDGHWHNRGKDAEFVSPQLNACSLDSQLESVRDTWCYRHVVGLGEVVLGVGAGIGDDVVAFSRMVGPAGHVIAVEAHPVTFDCLRKTISANRLENVTALQVAAAGETGELHISTGGNYQTSSLLHGKGGHAVAARRLDDLFAERGLPQPTFIKMNIEGAETSALRGMPRLLRKTRHVVISCHDFIADMGGSDSLRTHAEVASLLAVSGFTVDPPRSDRRPWIPFYLYGTLAA